MKAVHAREDAAEMYSILRTARCIQRYDSISHQLLAELVVAIATDGEVVGGNNRGSDVISPSGKIEVKSRILGTDGPFPRISLKAHNLEKSDWITAVRWTRDFEFFDAVALPKASAMSLFAGRLTDGRATHTAWQTWIAAPAAISLADKIRAALQDLAKRT